MKGLNTLLELIEAQKRLAIDRWGGVATKIEADLIDAAFEWIQNNIQIKDGVAEVNEDLPVKLSELQNEIVKIATRSKEYQKGLTQFLATIDEIQNNMTALHKEENGINIREIPGVNIATNIVIEETIDRYTENGLNAHFAAPLRELIYNNAMAGTNMKQARAYLRDYIATGKDKSGKLYRYLTQTAQQATDSFTAAINVEIQKKFKTVGMIISGSLIETSSKQCIMAVEESKPTNGFLTNEQWEKILEVARNNKKAELIDGTTLTNLDLNKLHWGCRHGFFPMLTDPTAGRKKRDLKKQTNELAAKAKKIAPEFDLETKAVAAKHGAAITPTNLKLPNRIQEKAINEYNGDVSKVKDAIRTTIVSPEGKIAGIMEDVKTKFNVEKIKVQSAATDPLGYSGNLINIKLKNGMFAEIQVNTPEMIYAKEPFAESIIGKAEFARIKEATGLPHGQGHAIYEEYRVLNPSSSAQKRLELEEKSKAYYKNFQ